MNHQGLTTEHIKSHLQKYRLGLKKQDDDDLPESERRASLGSSGSGGGGAASVNGSTVIPESRRASESFNSPPPPASVQTISEIGAIVKTDISNELLNVVKKNNNYPSTIGILSASDVMGIGSSAVNSNHNLTSAGLDYLLKGGGASRDPNANATFSAISNAAMGIANGNGVVQSDFKTTFDVKSLFDGVDAFLPSMNPLSIEQFAFLVVGFRMGAKMSTFQQNQQQNQQLQLQQHQNQQQFSM